MHEEQKVHHVDAKKRIVEYDLDINDGLDREVLETDLVDGLEQGVSVCSLP